jgi:hypothetical protein
VHAAPLDVKNIVLPSNNGNLNARIHRAGDVCSFRCVASFAATPPPAPAGNAAPRISTIAKRMREIDRG